MSRKGSTATSVKYNLEFDFKGKCKSFRHCHNWAADIQHYGLVSDNVNTLHIEGHVKTIPEVI
jgi:hypothetical protein